MLMMSMIKVVVEVVVVVVYCVRPYSRDIDN